MPHTGPVGGVHEHATRHDALADRVADEPDEVVLGLELVGDVEHRRVHADRPEGTAGERHPVPAVDDEARLRRDLVSVGRALTSS